MRVREPGHPGPRPRGRARADARLEEVRALLDLEPARGRGPRAPDAVRALRPGRDGAPAVRSAGLTAVVVLVLDLVTKHLALERLAPGRPVPVIDGFFSLTLVMNPGLAFGMLAGTPAGWRWLVALLSIGALAVLAVVGLRMLPTGGRAHPARAGADLRRRRRQPDRPRALRRGGGLPRLLLAGIPLAGLQRGGRVDLRRRGAAGAPHAHRAALPLSLISRARRGCPGMRPGPGERLRGRSSRGTGALSRTRRTRARGWIVWLAARLPGLSRMRVKGLIEAGPGRWSAGRAAKAALPAAGGRPGGGLDPAPAPGWARPGGRRAQHRVRGRARARRGQAGGHGDASRAPGGRPARWPRPRSRTLRRWPGSASPRRPGIVHRLDKGTLRAHRAGQDPGGLRRAHRPARARAP